MKYVLFLICANYIYINYHLLFILIIINKFYIIIMIFKKLKLKLYKINNVLIIHI